MYECACLCVCLLHCVSVCAEGRCATEPLIGLLPKRPESTDGGKSGISRNNNPLYIYY